MATLEIYSEINFGGHKSNVGETKGDLRDFAKPGGGNWNDEIQSFKAISGRWRFFEHVGFGGLGTKEFHPPDAINNCQDAGFPNKWISSIQLLGE